MQTYLCIRDFRRRKNKSGNEYGWGIAVYCTPEHIWGRDYVTSAYREEPEESALKIFARAKDLFPEAESVYCFLDKTGRPVRLKKEYPDFYSALEKAADAEEE